MEVETIKVRNLKNTKVSVIMEMECVGADLLRGEEICFRVIDNENYTKSILIEISEEGMIGIHLPYGSYICRDQIGMIHLILKTKKLARLKK